MLHILMLILKIIGIILLSVLGLVLILLGVVLLVPLRYCAMLEKEADIKAEGKISWFLGAFAICAKYEGSNIQMDVHLFGRSLLNRKAKKKKEKKKQSQRTEMRTEKLPEVKQAENTLKLPKKAASDEILGDDRVQQTAVRTPISKPVPEIQPEASEKTERTENTDGEKEERAYRVKHFLERMVHIPEQVRSGMKNIQKSVHRISNRLRNIKDQATKYLDFWNLEMMQASRQHVWKEIRYLLRHLTPRMVNGKLLIGFEDPATTGQVLGILSVLAVFGGNHLEVEADFQQSVLEGNLKIKGHIRLCHIAKSALSLLTDQNIRQTIKEFRSLTA